MIKEIKRINGKGSTNVLDWKMDWSVDNDKWTQSFSEKREKFEQVLNKKISYT